MELNNQARLSESGWPVLIASAVRWESTFIPQGRGIVDFTLLLFRGKSS